jgi:hypothetical protein
MAKSKFAKRLGVVSAVILGLVGIEEATTKLLKGAPLLVNAITGALGWNAVKSEEAKVVVPFRAGALAKKYV